MLQAGYVGMAALIGSGFAVQLTMIAAMSRARGPVEGAWVSLTATIAGFSLLLLYRAVAGPTLAFPWPFEQPLVWGGLFVVASVALAAVVRGLPPYFALAGLAAIPLLVGAGFFGPKIGIGLYLSAAITGQLVGSVLLDHVGAFGTHVYRIDLERALGVAALVVGVVLVRGIRW